MDIKYKHMSVVLFFISLVRFFIKTAVCSLVCLCCNSLLNTVTVKFQPDFHEENVKLIKNEVHCAKKLKISETGNKVTLLFAKRPRWVYYSAICQLYMSKETLSWMQSGRIAPWMRCAQDVRRNLLSASLKCIKRSAEPWSVNHRSSVTLYSNKSH